MLRDDGATQEYLPGTSFISRHTESVKLTRGKSEVNQFLVHTATLLQTDGYTYACHDKCKSYRPVDALCRVLLGFIFVMFLAIKSIQCNPMLGRPSTNKLLQPVTMHVSTVFITTIESIRTYPYFKQGNRNHHKSGNLR